MPRTQPHGPESIRTTFTAVEREKNGTTVSAGVRSFAAQIEDERNQFLLPGFATAPLRVRQRIRQGLSAIAAFENLLDRVFFTGYTPAPAIGAPRLWRVGLQ